MVEVGGAGTFAKSLSAARIGGHVCVIGVLSGTTTSLDVIPLLMQKLRVQGVLVGSREEFEAMNRAIALHKLRPAVDRVFAFTEAPEAFRHMERGAHFGKIVMKVMSELVYDRRCRITGQHRFDLLPQFCWREWLVQKVFR